MGNKIPVSNIVLEQILSTWSCVRKLRKSSAQIIDDENLTGQCKRLILNRQNSIYICINIYPEANLLKWQHKINA